MVCCKVSHARARVVASVASTAGSPEPSPGPDTEQAVRRAELGFEPEPGACRALDPGGPDCWSPAHSPGLRDPSVVTLVSLQLLGQLSPTKGPGAFWGSWRRWLKLSFPIVAAEKPAGGGGFVEEAHGPPLSPEPVASSAPSRLPFNALGSAPHFPGLHLRLKVPVLPRRPGTHLACLLLASSAC